MRRKYGDCQRKDGNCTLCSLVNYGRDCHNRPISKLEWARLSSGLSPKELSEASGVYIRQIQKVELGGGQVVGCAPVGVHLLEIAVRQRLLFGASLRFAHGSLLLFVLFFHNLL